MTDQTQFQDPQTQGAQQDDQNQDQAADIFGGDDDIFANSDVLEPIKEVDGKHEEETTENEDTTPVEDSHDIFETEKYDTVVEDEDEKEPEIVDSMPETSNEESDGDDDFFDPFNDDLEEIEEVSPVSETTPTEVETAVEEKEDIKEEKVEAPKEVVEDVQEEPKIDDEPDFENSPEIDALDDLDDLDTEVNLDNLDDKIEEEKEEIQPPKSIPNIDETIKRIEARAAEAKRKAEEMETSMAKENKIQEPAVEEKEDVKEEKVEAPKEVVEDIKEEPKEEIEEKEEEVQEAEEEKEEEKIEINPLKTDLQNKFDELIRNTKAVYGLLDKKADEWFDLIWWNDDRIKTTYKISMMEDNHVEIQKEEFNKVDETNLTHTLDFILNKESLSVNVDDELLYDEVNDLQENPNKKMQVMEKLNKFIFLVSEEYKKVEKEKWEKEKRNKMKWVFRNFMF